MTWDTNAITLDAAEPTTDLPNGNGDLFYDDPQHPNAAGHVIIANAFATAITGII